MPATTEKRLSRPNDLITRRIPLENVEWFELSEDIERLMKDSGIETPELIRKGIETGEKAQYDDEERTSVDYITTKTIDRDSEVVVPSGAVLDHYRKHPVVLFAHDYSNMPVGKALWIKSDKNGLIAKTRYRLKGKGNEVWEYRKEGFPMAKSIGFIPLSIIDEKDFGDISDEEFKSMEITKDDIQGASRIYPKWLMLEYSDVPVPSNPDALQLALSKGIISGEELQKAIDNDAFSIEIKEAKSVDVEFTEEKEVVLKPETTDNYHHIPIRSADDFVDDSFRTINITDGIKAVIGKLKSDPDGSTKVQKYMLDVNKYTMEEAQSWVDEHKDQEPEEQKDIVADPSPEKNMLSERYGKEVVEIIKEANENLSVESLTLDTVISSEDQDIEALTSDTISPSTSTGSGGVGAHDHETDEDHTYTLGKYIFKSFEDVEGADGPWNNNLSKGIEIEDVNIEPASKLYDIASKWLDCPIKEIYKNEFSVPSALIGTFLTGFEKILSEYELVDTRNFVNYESPPVYDTIQLTADSSEDFLVSGIQFFTDDDSKVIVSRSPSWYGMDFVVMSKFEIRDESKSIISKAQIWAKENNMLKGQKFSLSGRFLESNDETWDSIFLSEKNFNPVKKSFDLIEEKGKELPNRGIMLVGPPGTGKTMTCRIAMNLTESTFIWVSARDFRYSGSVGGMSYAFSLAKELAPTILCIEDIDNWLSGHTVDILKSEMDGIVKSNGVVTYLTSNYPEKIPEALIDRPGRFHDILNFDYPDPETKARMINSWAIGVSEKSCSDIIKDTDGFSGAHMYELVSFAKRLMEDDESLSIDEALQLSLDKLLGQKRLIQELRGEKSFRETLEEAIDEEIEEKDFTSEENEDIITEKDTPSDDLVEKEGRVLSKNTRTILGKTLVNLEMAVSALKEFMEAVDKEEKDEPVVEIEDEEPENENEEVIEITEEGLKSAMEDILGELFSQELTKVDTDELILEGIRKAKGQIF